MYEFHVTVFRMVEHMTGFTFHLVRIYLHADSNIIVQTQTIGNIKLKGKLSLTLSSITP
jgi:hypothetical protein